jgi:hypothetical protein
MSGSWTDCAGDAEGRECSQLLVCLTLIFIRKCFSANYIEIPDDLFRKAKAQAALEGVRLRDVIERRLRLVLAEPAPRASRRVHFPLHRSQRPGALSVEDVHRAEEQVQRDEDASRANTA